MASHRALSAGAPEVTFEPQGNRVVAKPGMTLLEAAEAWALEGGVSLIRVSSNVARERAHAFYIREGYGIIKTSHQFSKRLL